MRTITGFQGSNSGGVGGGGAERANELNLFL